MAGDMQKKQSNLWAQILFNVLHCNFKTQFTYMYSESTEQKKPSNSNAVYLHEIVCLHYFTQ